MGEKEKATYQVDFSDNAKTHLKNIEDYIAIEKQQPINAITVIDTIFAKVDHIEQNPFAFKECRLLKTKHKLYRQVSCLSWNIYYKVMDKKILILGIISHRKSNAVIKALKKVK
jgi:plasmid stabilization system protein ParE